MEAIIAQDEELGARRNHATEDTSLSAAIHQYTAGVRALDFSACPEAFTTAFQEHLDAWEASIGFFSRYDSLRAEMHELFLIIEKEQPDAYQAALKPIMDTWGEVENERESLQQKS